MAVDNAALNLYYVHTVLRARAAILSHIGTSTVIENVRDVNGATVIELTGRFDANTVPKIKPRLHELIAEGRCYLVVDLNGLTFLDSSGLGVLVGCLRRCAAMGGDMCLTHVPEFARSVLELTRLTRVFQIADSPEAAAELVKKRGA